MAELLAQGSKPEQRWRRCLPAQGTLVLGRAADWSVAWDPFISREHVRLTWNGQILKIDRLPTAVNPLFHHGQEVAQATLELGDHFVIGETTFSLSEDSTCAPANDPLPFQERAVTANELEGIPFRNAPHQIDVLSRLPEVISGAANDEELFARLGNMLLAGVRRAEAVALVASDTPQEEQVPVKVLYWDRRLSRQGDFRPSQRLVRQALTRQQTVVHAWHSSNVGEPTFTAQGNFDWALCTPVRGEVAHDWGIYLAGHFGSDTSATLLAPWEKSDLGDDLKFTELVASILSSLRQVQQLQRKQTLLSPFFSPAVLRTFADADPEAVLQPRETDVTVLFCDLRGFSRHSEKQADKLMRLLERVSKALGVMTQNILDQGGVIADFQGDAALGFWGWPLAQTDKARRACAAALEIRRMFETSAREPGHPLADFHVGIGVASGPAVAGKIGTPEQAKVGVFGPVVNLASRLQGMTKILHAPILLDEQTGAAARERLPHDLGRCRRLIRVQPYGMEKPLTVTELLPAGPTYPGLSDDEIKFYEAALDAFLEGKWTRAYELIHMVPPHDRGKDFLTSYIIQHDHTPPAGWNGVIALEAKN